MSQKRLRWAAGFTVMCLLTAVLTVSRPALPASAEPSPFDAMREKVRESASSPSPATKSPLDQMRENVKSTSGAPSGQAGSGPQEARLPVIAGMENAAENGKLRLKADALSGHFLVEDKRSGHVWTSFPDPAGWNGETSQGQWRTNMVSPLILEYVDPKTKNDKPRLTNLLEQGGKIEGFKLVEGGFDVTFNLKPLEISIPVQVRLLEDSVETKLVSSGIREGKFLLTSVMAYPFFGAYQSTGQDGYLLVPDGSGALIRFRENRQGSTYNYDSDVYGIDWAVKNTSYFRTRAQTTMPVFGIKSGSQGMLAAIHEGDAYAQVKASPSGHLTTYNWASFKFVYRDSYWQPTSSNPRLMRTQGYNAYPKDKYEGDRSVLYFLLETNKSDYSGMAERYRNYLVEEKGFKKREAAENIPLYLDILGADLEKGFFFNRYRKATDTEQAIRMVDSLRQLGVKNMIIRYLGWQEDGFSTYGANAKVDKRIGGEEGMKRFIDYAHQLNIPVYLFAVYEWNNTGSFSERNFGMVDRGNTVIKYYNDLLDADETMVSPKYAAEQLFEDLPFYKRLGVDGVSFNTIGRFLNSDFNSGYELTRQEATGLQQEVFRRTKESLGGVSGNRSNLYVSSDMNHIYRMTDDYSYDVFADEPVPFIQMVLHGLVSYSFSPSNDREQYRQDLLRSIEYGALPHFVFSHEPANELKKTYEFSFYWNPEFEAWKDVVETEYKRYNEALADIQDAFMTGHRTLTKDVKEVTYSNGKRIIVNYGDTPYEDGDLSVPAKDFVSVKGGSR